MKSLPEYLGPAMIPTVQDPNLKDTWMDLLAVIDTHDVSGPGRQLVALLKEARSSGISGEIVTFQREGRSASSFATFARREGVVVHEVPERGPLDFSALKAFVDLIRLRRPDVIQTHSYKGTAMAWLARKRGLTFRWVGCIHGSTSENAKVRLYHWLDNRLLSGADEIVIVAESQRRSLGTSGSRAHRISNAVIPSSSSGAPVAFPLESASRPRFAFLGRLSPEKGADILLSAIALLEKSHGNHPWSVIMAGDGQEGPRLRDQARRDQTESRIHWAGFLENPWSLYGAVDCVVLPSRSEAMPNVLLEAISLDLPVICTGVGGIPAAIGAGHAALLIEPESPSELAAAMRPIIEGTPEHEAAAADRATLRADHSVANRARAFVELYKSG